MPSVGLVYFLYGVMAVAVVVAREFKVSTAKYGGSSQYDFTYLTKACSALGDYIPARIENKEQNDAAWAECQTVGIYCNFEVVRDDAAKSQWYYYTDGAFNCEKPIEYLPWAMGQPQSRGEACVGYWGSSEWHDMPCDESARVLCMEKVGEEPPSIGGDSCVAHTGCACPDQLKSYIFKGDLLNVDISTSQQRDTAANTYDLYTFSVPDTFSGLYVRACNRGAYVEPFTFFNVYDCITGQPPTKVPNDKIHFVHETFTARHIAKDDIVSYTTPDQDDEMRTPFYPGTSCGDNERSMYVDRLVKGGKYQIVVQDDDQYKIGRTYDPPVPLSNLRESYMLLSSAKVNEAPRFVEYPEVIDSDVFDDHYIGYNVVVSVMSSVFVLSICLNVYYFMKYSLVRMRVVVDQEDKNDIF